MRHVTPQEFCGSLVMKLIPRCIGREGREIERIGGEGHSEHHLQDMICPLYNYVYMYIYTCMLLWQELPPKSTFSHMSTGPPFLGTVTCGVWFMSLIKDLQTYMNSIEQHSA